MKNIRTPKQFFFFIIKPIFPLFRDLFLKADLVEVKGHKVRQRFPIGFLHKDADPEELETYLCTQGFFREKMALVDPDEIFGMRKLDPEHPCFQYHIRLYADGELRGHYEKTPEDFPIDHFNEVGFEARAEEFQTLFKKFLVSNLETRGHTEAPLYYTAHPEAAGDGGQ